MVNNFPKVPITKHNNQFALNNLCKYSENFENEI